MMVLEAGEEGGEQLCRHQVQGHNLLQGIEANSLFWCLQTLPEFIMKQLKLREGMEGGEW